MGWPLGCERPSAAASSTACESDQLDRRPGRAGLDYKNPLSRSPPRVPALKTHPEIARDPRRRQDGVLRREGDPRGRLVVDAAPLRRRLPDRRRLGRHAQRPAPQGHPPRDEVGHARRRDDLRGAARRRTAPRETPRRLRAARSRRAGSRTELWPVRNFHQAFDHGYSCRHAPGGARPGDRRPRLGRPRPPGHRARPRADDHRSTTPDGRATRIAEPVASSTASSPSTSWPTSTTPAPRTTRTSRSTCWWRTPTSASTAAREEYANPCQRFCPAAVYEMVADAGDARRQAPADQRQQLRPLQDLRHHGPLRDHHLGPARGRRRPRLPEPVTVHVSSDAQT